MFARNGNTDAKGYNRAGIEAIEVYFPSQYVEQSQLEEHDGVGKGKYTIGLGQSQIAFTGDFENVHSLALTVVSNLMKKSKYSYQDIGRLTVSSETIIDKSKSIKSVVMQLFEGSGNHDVEGCDYLNACYGGTAAFFDAVTWVKSDDWDGRRAIVVAVDIAEYAPGPARPTGGAGAIAMLIGPDPVISLEPGRANYMKNVYDFYKPYLSSPFPVVNGKLSNECFLESLDECYEKFRNVRMNRFQVDSQLEDWDYFVFHSPYNKLVQKSFGRLMYNDFLLNPTKPEYADFKEYLDIPKEDTRSHRGIYKAFAKASKKLYDERVAPSTVLPKAIGNCYTASAYCALISLLVEKEAIHLQNTNVLTFSYGSGLCSSLFHLKFTDDLSRIEAMQKQADYRHRLSDRVEVLPGKFNTVMDDKCAALKNDREHFMPSHTIAAHYPGTYYLDHRTAAGEYQYKCSTADAATACSEL